LCGKVTDLFNSAQAPITDESKSILIAILLTLAFVTAGSAQILDKAKLDQFLTGSPKRTRRWGA
jgi:hypothetical protein